MRLTLTIDLKINDNLRQSYTVQSSGRYFMRRKYKIRKTDSLCWSDYIFIWGRYAPKNEKIAIKALRRMVRGW